MRRFCMSVDMHAFISGYHRGLEAYVDIGMGLWLVLYSLCKRIYPLMYPIILYPSMRVLALSL